MYLNESITEDAVHEWSHLCHGYGGQAEKQPVPMTTRIAWPRNRESGRCHPPEMLKPPWWTASLLFQHMVDEMGEKSLIKWFCQGRGSNIIESGHGIGRHGTVCRVGATPVVRPESVIGSPDLAGCSRNLAPSSRNLPARSGNLTAWSPNLAWNSPNMGSSSLHLPPSSLHLGLFPYK